MKIGIIGCGLNSGYHIHFAKTHPGAEIVGLVDLKRSRRAAGRHGIIGAYADPLTCFAAVALTKREYVLVGILLVGLFLVSIATAAAPPTSTAYPYRNLSLQARSLKVPIAYLAEWEANMKTYGASLCQVLLSTASGAEDPANYDTRYRGTYYDGERVYYQIADYTNEPKTWNFCARLAEQFYRDKFLATSKSSPQGHDISPHGLYIDYLRTGDAVSKQYAIDLSYNAAFASPSTPLLWTVDSQNSRPVAYNIMSFLVSEELGEPRRGRLVDLVSQALGHSDQWFVSRTAVYVRPFMAGLTAEALIQYYEKTKDPRIPPAIQTAMDWLWRNTWRPSPGAFMYTDRDTANIDNSGGTDPAPVLNLLIAPAYAWLYRHTRDIKYRDQADQIFAGNVSQAKSFLSKTDGKFFNQNYRWSFDYIKWRVEGELGSIIKPAPTDATSPAGFSCRSNGRNKRARNFDRDSQCNS